FDPLLNTILPGTGVSLVMNFGELWAAGRSLATAALLPRVCVVGPVTQTRILQVGKSAHAIGACFHPDSSHDLFGVPASELVDRIVPLANLWRCSEVEGLFALLARRETGYSVMKLREELLKRRGESAGPTGVGPASAAFMRLRGGLVSIEDMARANGLSRREFGRKFTESAGLPPKLFARITRFQRLVHTLLSTDIAHWAGASSASGFYDQAHMINEFRSFAGAPPTIFFRPHGMDGSVGSLVVRGRPSE